jgi:hypothetical protein
LCCIRVASADRCNYFLNFGRIVTADSAKVGWVLLGAAYTVLVMSKQHARRRKFLLDSCEQASRRCRNNLRSEGEKGEENARLEGDHGAGFCLLFGVKAQLVEMGKKKKDISIVVS